MNAAVPFFAAERTWAEHGERYAQLMAEALAGGQALQGPAVRAFEAALAARCGRAHAVAVGSGTDALAFALLAAGVGPGDEVLVPAISFIATASCVLRVGAVPVFVDVDPWLRLDLDAARALVTPATRALLAVDLYGQTVDHVAFERFADEHGLTLVEDAAQALGATHAGAIGALSCCSFDPTKTIAAPGSGGAVLCDDDALAAALRRLRWHGRDDAGRFATLGHNSQLPTAAAAVLHAKLASDARWTERRRAIAAAYDAALAGTPHRPVGVAPGRDHVFHKYVLRTPDRTALAAALAAAGVPTRVHYDRPLYREPVFGHRGRACPAAETACREVLSLPIHAYLTDAEVELVTTTLAAAS
ncbi:perosamine synthetase [Solirubrobacter pauli]|uniref:Perosamine synthetase n=1 Tax=Solirubrobacter pauli TaxID=166793 RepID=A0A660L5I5_9ACTN|nr:aminotransferase class I/II-fold pyridoxal phosphate-dependent enzyme [Solirubrobacter pauli]RKQ90247.1 perosamine synthetase [Solirubrobacter pauli]